jgi:Tol biopolymer transport system component
MKRTTALLRLALLALACLLVAAGGGCKTAETPQPQSGDFADPQRVTILGYSGDAMEPFISRDGKYLFFNNSNDPAVDTNLHWAERIDDLTFQYKGEIGGVNTTKLDGVASMDRNGVFYFVSTRSYDLTASTVYRGSFDNGTVTGVELAPGVSTATPGIVNFDAEISPDGQTLYFVESRFSASGQPQTADILTATWNGSAFVRDSNSTTIMEEVNRSKNLEYAPAISASGLELFFTRLEGSSPVLYVSTRTDASSPFGAPRKITAATGFVEGPTLSPDEKSLYYHKREGDRFVIYRVTRPSATTQVDSPSDLVV